MECFTILRYIIRILGRHNSHLRLFISGFWPTSTFAPGSAGILWNRRFEIYCFLPSVETKLARHIYFIIVSLSSTKKLLQLSILRHDLPAILLLHHLWTMHILWLSCSQLRRIFIFHWVYVICHTLLQTSNSWIIMTEFYVWCWGPGWKHQHVLLWWLLRLCVSTHVHISRKVLGSDVVN